MKSWEHPQYKKLSNFTAWLKDMSEAGFLTPKQYDEVTLASLRIFHAAGLPNNPEADEVTLAVLRHEYQAKKDKAAELCPMLAHEINTFDERNSRFWQHPLAIQIEELREWIFAQSWEKNMPNWDQYVEILKAGYGVFLNTGLPRGPDVDDATVAAFHQQLHIMKSKLVECCPDLADSLRSFLAGRSR